jgi:acetyl-CoA carboxylase biotin carboxyl carrier protein
VTHDRAAPQIGSCFFSEQAANNRSQEKAVDLKDIKAIIDLMKKNSITEFELERQDFKIRLKRGQAVASSGEESGAIYQSPSVTPLALPGQAGAPVPVLPAPSVSNELEIKSPMVGTFYRAPSPESAPYVEVGTEVHPESVVCIIEAMKVMNEIKSEVRGVITQILIDNAKPVEFGQAIFKVRPI